MMYPFRVDYWPLPYNENTWVRIEILARDAEDCERRFQEKNIPCSYYIVHEPLMGE